MKNECSIVRDLLPLYAEDMLSPETSEFVAEHLKGCDGCREEFERTKELEPAHCDVSDAAPLKLIRKRLYLKRIGTAACAVVLALALFVSAFAVLDAPEYLPYSQGLVTVEELDGGLKLSFGKGVTDFDFRTYADPDDPDHLLCSVEAWTSIWRGSAEATSRLPADPCPLCRSAAVAAVPRFQEKHRREADTFVPAAVPRFVCRSAASCRGHILCLVLDAEGLLFESVHFAAAVLRTAAVPRSASAPLRRNPVKLIISENLQGKTSLQIFCKKLLHFQTTEYSTVV